MLSDKNLKKRYRQERRFQWYGRIAILLSLGALVWLMGNMAIKSVDAFQQTYIKLDFYFDKKIVSPGEDGLERLQKGRVNLSFFIRKATEKLFPDVIGRKNRRALKRLISQQATRIQLQDYLLTNTDAIGEERSIWVLASDDVDQYMKGHISRKQSENDRRLSDQQLDWLEYLQEQGRIDKFFNATFFTAGDSSQPELAGIWGAMVGSFYTMLMTLLLSFPVAVAAAVYLEEFAPRNRWTDLIEVNINNLAAVPSIIFGLLGLAVFIQLFGLPRSAPLVGGMVLSLMTLPTIIIATRVSLKSVPYPIREAALGLGASPFQAVFHHVLPLAMPGILTGTIIGMARALGETAPLLMIGMVAFIVDIPSGPLDQATALPVQIFLWADKPEQGFVAKTAAAIIVLMLFLVLMNALAIYLRKKFEKRW